jgi:hypothetical protein
MPFLFVAATLVVAVTLFFTLRIRAKDLPPAEPVSPTRHLEEKKAQIYENLRDLQFEYRVGKLSDEDYQQTKLGLQKELAAVLAEIEKIAGGAVPQPEPQPATKTDATICPHCHASFSKPMKFCGECGKAMAS